MAEGIELSPTDVEYHHSTAHEIGACVTGCLKYTALVPVGAIIGLLGVMVGDGLMLDGITVFKDIFEHDLNAGVPSFIPYCETAFFFTFLLALLVVCVC